MIRLSNFLQKELVVSQRTPESAATLKLAIKTGLAALLTDVLGRWLNLPGSDWAVVTSMIVMQANLGSSFNASFHRLVGTAVGALTGALFVTFGGTNPVLMGIGTTITILLCALLQVYESFRIATVTLVIVMLVRSADVSPWHFGLERFVDVGFGILVALAVTIGLWPPRARQDLRQALADTLSIDARLYTHLVESHLHEEPAITIAEMRGAIKQKLTAAQALMEDIGREPTDRRDPALATLVAAVDHLQVRLFALEENQTVIEHSFYCRLEAELLSLCQVTGQTLQNLAEAVRQERPPAPLPELQQALLTLEQRYGELRYASILRELGAEEALRFVGFLSELKSMVLELNQLADALTDWIQD